MPGRVGGQTSRIHQASVYCLTCSLMNDKADSYSYFQEDVFMVYKLSYLSVPLLYESMKKELSSNRERKLPKLTRLHYMKTVVLPP